jgi:PAS domain S-box-containing protein
MTPPRIDAAALLAAIVASSDDAIVSKDLDGIITSWNRGAERIFGYTADEVIGRSIRIIIPDDRQAEEDMVLAKIRRGEPVEHFETIRRRKDGTLLPISVTISPVRSASGEIVGASKIARDISERWRTETALAEAAAAQADLQRRLLTLVGASGWLLGSPRVTDVVPATMKLAGSLVPADGYAVWRFDPRLRHWTVAGFYGVSAEFATKVIAMHNGKPTSLMPSAEPIVAEDVQADPMLADRRAAYEREGIKSMLAIPLTIRGEISGTLVLYHRSPHKFSEVETQTAHALGNLAAGAITTAELYDEQQRSHELATFLAAAGSALGNSLDHMATLRTVAEMAVPRISDWCAVDLINEEGEVERLVLAHVDPAKVEFALAFQERYPDDPNSRYSVAEVIRTGEALMIERVTDEMLLAAARCEDHLKGLRSLDVKSVMIVPLIARGRRLGALTFASAESGRVYTAADLRFAEDVASRAAMAVDNARAYEEAQRANRLKDDFLATLSHELRTPLNAILGYARMLRTGVMGPEKQGRALEVLERSAVSLTQIVEDVLDVSRITSGKIRLNLQPVKLQVVVNDAVATVLPAAEAKGIAIVTDLDPDVPIVRGDPDRLQQVVWNLMSNAVKFTPTSGRVEVRVTRSDGCARVSVTDTGIGFAPEFAPHMFERFRQADSGFARTHGGLGLGLAIARHLIEMHGGTIDASSEGTGKGATFSVELPLARSAHREPVGALPPRRKAELFDAGALVGLDSLRVLAIDDDADALALVREILEAGGATVETAASAEAALEQMTRTPPDIVIADLGMPGMDGFELISRIRRSSNVVVRGLPAIALTAYARSDDRMRALRQGFQMHLPKPIDPSELVSAVASLTRPSNLTAS